MVGWINSVLMLNQPASFTWCLLARDSTQSFGLLLICLWGIGFFHALSTDISLWGWRFLFSRTFYSYQLALKLFKFHCTFFHVNGKTKATIHKYSLCANLRDSWSCGIFSSLSEYLKPRTNINPSHSRLFRSGWSCSAHHVCLHKQTVLVWFSHFASMFPFLRTGRCQGAGKTATSLQQSLFLKRCNQMRVLGGTGLKCGVRQDRTSELTPNNGQVKVNGDKWMK